MERKFFSELEDFIKTRSTLENNWPHKTFSWCDVQHVNMFDLSELIKEGHSQILGAFAPDSSRTLVALKGQLRRKMKL